MTLLEQRIQALVDAAPPLTDGQRRRLALLLNPGAVASFTTQGKAAPALPAETAIQKGTETPMTHSTSVTGAVR